MYIHKCIQAAAALSSFTRTYIYIYIFRKINMHIYIYKCIYLYICIYIYIYIYIYINVYRRQQFSLVSHEKVRANQKALGEKNVYRYEIIYIPRHIYVYIYIYVYTFSHLVHKCIIIISTPPLWRDGRKESQPSMLTHILPLTLIFLTLILPLTLIS
jgi:hypothetical protein